MGWLTASKKGELEEGGTSVSHPQIWALNPSHGLLSSAHPSQPTFPSHRRRCQAAQGQRGAAGGSDNPTCPKDGYFGTAAAPCCPTGKGDVSLPSLEVGHNLHHMLDVELHGASSYISALVFRAQDSTSRLVLPCEPALQSSFRGPISPHDACWLGEAPLSRSRLNFSIFCPEGRREVFSFADIVNSTKLSQEGMERAEQGRGTRTLSFPDLC